MHPPSFICMDYEAVLNRGIGQRSFDRQHLTHLISSHIRFDFAFKGKFALIDINEWT